MAKHQLWHVVDRAVPKVAMGDGTEASWPKDYYHVADVEASNVDEVFRKTQRRVTEKGSWDSRKGVFAHVSIPRSTAPGDVVVTPEGKVVRYLPGDDNQELTDDAFST